MKMNAMTWVYPNKKWLWFQTIFTFIGRSGPLRLRPIVQGSGQNHHWTFSRALELMFKPHRVRTKGIGVTKFNSVYISGILGKLDAST